MNAGIVLYMAELYVAKTVTSVCQFPPFLDRYNSSGVPGARANQRAREPWGCEELTQLGVGLDVFCG